MYRINTKENSNVSLNEIIITHEESNFKSIIFPNLGASLQKLFNNDIEIIDGIPATEDGLAIYKERYNSSFLFPFPSRIEDGKYSFNGKEYQLEINDKALNNALHGHIYNKPFKLKNKIVSKSKAKVKLTYKYLGENNSFPFPYRINITYIFTKEGLKVRFKVKNTGTEKFPFGIGWHPYFMSSNLMDSTLNIKSLSQSVFNDRMIPTDETSLNYKFPFNINDVALDNCFTTKESFALFKNPDYTMKMEFSSKPPNSFIQVYTPPNRNSIAIEPMTCGGNAFNSKNGLLTLKPNEAHKWIVNLSF